MRMSGRPMWASSEPSTISTIPWMIDCGCTSTLMRSAGRPKSQRASMISSALFISVALSMVILRPMRQVGCSRACCGVTSSICRRLQPLKGPPLAVRMMRATWLRGTPLQELKDGAVLAVHGQDRRPALRGPSLPAWGRP